MRKIRILIALLLVALLVLLLTRCGGKKTALSEENSLEEAGQKMETVLPKEAKFGTVEALTEGGVAITVEENGETVVHKFSDVQADDWYLDAVNYVLANGLMNGMPSAGDLELFKPDYGMTRAQLATILYRLLGGEQTAAKRTYADVPEGEWYYDCINWADSEGYITPESEESFGAESYCSCEEVLMILHRTAGSPKSTATLEEYPYAPKVSEDGIEAVRWAWEKGLIAEDACVWYPTQAVSRAQIALLLMRYDVLIGASA